MQTTIVQSALEKCSGLIICREAYKATQMLELADDLGFGACALHSDADQVINSFMPFYLVDDGIPDAIKLRIVQSLRASDEPRKKYAPVILLLPRGPAYKSIFYFEMGFDDVLFLTDGLASMRARLAEQLAREVVFIETKHYFGPDRRRVERVSRGDPRRRPGGSTHTKLVVFRDPLTGPRVERRP